MEFLGVNDNGHEEFREEKDGSVLIRIPAGGFLLGTSDEEIRRMLEEWPDSLEVWFQDERPLRTTSLPGFHIGKHAVTNARFSEFVRRSGYRTRGNWRAYAQPGREMHPVVGVAWEEAAAYCEWAGLRLPSEAEWERAARGTDGRGYPWGNHWDGNLCNNLTADRSDLVGARTSGSDCRTIPVGMIPEGASPCGALDMAGNVWEWCAGGAVGASRPVRGGSWHGDTPAPFRCAARLERPPSEGSLYTGFRCARGI